MGRAADHGGGPSGITRSGPKNARDARLCRSSGGANDITGISRLSETGCDGRRNAVVNWDVAAAEIYIRLRRSTGCRLVMPIPSAHDSGPYVLRIGAWGQLRRA